MKLSDILLLSPDKAAPYLLGATIISVAEGIETGGIITEVEAYLASDDAAAHNSRGQTRANASLFKAAGTLYIHQMRQWLLLDIVTEDSHVPSSLLIRAFAPTIGIETMTKRRNENDIKKLANGPGKVCQALGITRNCDGTNLFDSTPQVKVALSKQVNQSSIETSRRVGITKNAEVPLRFVLK